MMCFDGALAVDRISPEQGQGGAPHAFGRRVREGQVQLPRKVASPHHDQQGGSAFLETGTLRRGSSCAKTQVGADAAAEPCTSCAVRGEISPDADPWAARWVADLRELGPFDERGVLQRMGIDVRALFFESRIGNRLHCHGCHDIAPSITGGASPTVGLPRSGAVAMLF